MNTICFDQNYFFLTILLLIIITSYFIYNIPKNINISHTKTDKTDNIIDEREKPFVDVNLMKDYNTLNDPLTPPTKRAFGYHYTQRYPNNIGVHTRGQPYNFQMIGYLKRPTDNKVIQLFGRQAYPNSNLYDYYGIFKDKDQTEIKVDIKKGGNSEHSKQIYKGDEIKIDFLQGEPEGNVFIAELYKVDRTMFQYNPYIV
jgi:hypothetical protein